MLGNGIEDGDLEIRGSERRCERGGPGVEERGEDAAVAAVFGFCAGEGGVAFEDCDAKGKRRHAVLCYAVLC